MPLGAKDILLVIRATDQASATISRVAGSFGTLSSAQAAAATNTLKHGAALTMLGAGLIAVGKQGFDTLKSWGKAAADYNQEAALTLTQIDQTGVKLEDVKKIGREVAMAIPAPFEQMQESLFDIFSSMDVGTKDAQMILTAFAKGAVAGQTEVQTAGRATIAMMNTFKIPFQDVNKVMDTQFQLVRKGVGTYEEFASVLGRAAPSAVRLGQNFETLAGMLAFMTRNGLSTAQASTSAARALDALSKTKVAERMDAMGISLRDATGNYRPLVDIVRDLNSEYANLSKPEKAAALEELFKGAGGTIQARRFFDLALNNFDEFEKRVGEMQNSAGAMDKAYDIMFEQPQTQMQRFKNQIAVIRTELGDHLLGAANKLVGAGIKLTEWFEGLSPSVKKGIVTFIAFASAASVVVGSVFALIGVFLIIKATLALAAVSFAAVGLAAIGIIAVIALVAAAGYLIYRNWDTLGPKFKEVFNILKYYAQIAWDKIQEFAEWVMTWLPGVWDDVQSKAKTAWQAIWEGAQLAWSVIQDVVAWLIVNVPPVWEKIGEVAGGIWQFIIDKASAFFGWLQENVFPVFLAFGAMVDAFVDRVYTIWTWLWENLTPAVQFAFTIITDLFTVGFALWSGAFQLFFAVVMAIWGPLWTFVQEIVSVAWNFIKQTIENYLAIITGVFQFFAALFRGDWAGMWQAVKDIAAAVWAQIGNIINTAFDLIFAIARGAMNLIWQTMQAGWDAILGTASTVPGRIFSALASLVDLLWDLGYRGTRNMLNAIQNGVGEIIGFLGTVPGKVTGALAGLGTALFNLGADAIRGLLNGIASMAGRVVDAAKGVADRVRNTIAGALNINSPSVVMHQMGRMVGMGLANGIASMGPAVGAEMERMARQVTGQDMTVPVGWGMAGGPGTSGAGSPFAGSTIDIDININGTDLSAEQVGEITKKEVKSALNEVYRELLTGPRR